VSGGAAPGVAGSRHRPCPRRARGPGSRAGGVGVVDLDEAHAWYHEQGAKLVSIAPIDEDPTRNPLMFKIEAFLNFPGIRSTR